MTNLTTALAAIRSRTEAVEPIPYKKFPIVMLNDGEQYRLMNEYMQFGLDARHDIPKLLAAVERLSLGLETAYAHCKHVGDGHYELGKQLRIARAEVEQMFANGGE